MINVENKAKCSGCHACVSICPKCCISMKRDEEGFLYPVVDESACISCGLCEKVCPIINPKKIDKNKEDIKAYAAYTKNEEIRKKSSSGGIFTEIAAYIINKGGVVFGASFDESWGVKHVCVDNIDDLSKFRGSKYVQSTIGNTYKEAKEYLDNGKMVLFTGTPCQIGGLYSYLNRDYDNLITQDLICHGVPSPAVWEKYLEYQDKVHSGRKLQSIAFKSKKTGWKRYSMQLCYDDDEYLVPVGKDYMLQVFLKNLCLRPSCYNCSFKTKIRQSDITLADFWGIENVLPNIDDDKGISLILLNSKAGNKIFDEISSNIWQKDVDFEEGIKYNSSMIQSPTIHKKRESYMKCFDKYEFDVVAKRYLKKPLWIRMKQTARNFLKRGK